MPKQMKRRSWAIDIDGYKLYEAIDSLSKLAEKIGKNCVIDSDIDGSNLCAIYETEETDNEYNLRVKLEKLRSDKELDSRKAQYEKLKLEFDGL